MVKEIQNGYVCFWEERVDKAVVDSAVKRTLDAINDDTHKVCHGVTLSQFHLMQNQQDQANTKKLI